MRSDELDFELPAELIAQTPAAERAGSRLLRYRRDGGSIEHRRFVELPGLLRKGNLLVFNDARVLPARFELRKETGGRVEGLFLAEIRPGRWRVMLRNLGRSTVPLHFEDAPEVAARVAAAGEGGEYEMEVTGDESALGLLARIGRMPLPPYIKRARHRDERDELDRERYQTVYARSPGSVAAPTAGLHFTSDLLAELNEAGIERTSVTLHVGMGTFKPITAETLEGHVMHSETYSISPEAAEALNRAKKDGRRIVAVGTTSARVLESQEDGRPFEAKEDQTRIFIYPPYRWKHVGGVITNFHLPRSTLIALVAAMVRVEEQRRVYSVAIQERYRFFSYGDAMLVE